MEMLRSSNEAPGVSKEQADVISVRCNRDDASAWRRKATYLGTSRKTSMQRLPRLVGRGSRLRAHVEVIQSAGNEHPMRGPQEIKRQKPSRVFRLV